MNYTKNLKLPQWSSSDRVRMEDFNSAMANIENGVNAVSEKVQDASIPFVIGTYVGDGTKIVDVQLGFRPSFVIISGMKQCTEENINDALRYFIITDGNSDLIQRVQFASFGFVAYSRRDSGIAYPDLAEEGRTYHYIAFK